jgi:predicted phosphodiesterase
MCGHTHVPLIERGEVTIVNPGSISQPRQEGHIPTYLVMNIENGQVDFVPVHLKQ